MAKDLRNVSMGKIKTGVYHAGITDSQKENLYKEWRNGNVKVVCATIGLRTCVRDVYLTDVHLSLWPRH